MNEYQFSPVVPASAFVIISVVIGEWMGKCLNVLHSDPLSHMRTRTAFWHLIIMDFIQFILREAVSAFSMGFFIPSGVLKKSLRPH